MVKLELHYYLTGSGWSETWIGEVNNIITVTASYLSDALGNLASGALSVLNSIDEVRFSFDEEPGEYRWIIEKRHEDIYQLTIRWFPELWGHKPDEDGKVILEYEIAGSEFARLVLKALDDVWQQYGETGYKDKWGRYNFPLQEMSELSRLLNGTENLA